MWQQRRPCGHAACGSSVASCAPPAGLLRRRRRRPCAMRPACLYARLPRPAPPAFLPAAHLLLRLLLQVLAVQRRVNRVAHHLLDDPRLGHLCRRAARSNGRAQQGGMRARMSTAWAAHGQQVAASREAALLGPRCSAGSSRSCLGKLPAPHPPTPGPTHLSTSPPWCAAAAAPSSGCSPATAPPRSWPATPPRASWLAGRECRAGEGEGKGRGASGREAAGCWTTTAPTRRRRRSCQARARAVLLGRSAGRRPALGGARAPSCSVIWLDSERKVALFMASLATVRRMLTTSLAMICGVGGVGERSSGMAGCRGGSRTRGHAAGHRCLPVGSSCRRGNARSGCMRAGKAGVRARLGGHQVVALGRLFDQLLRLLLLALHLCRHAGGTAARGVRARRLLSSATAHRARWQAEISSMQRGRRPAHGLAAPAAPSSSQRQPKHPAHPASGAPRRGSQS